MAKIDSLQQKKIFSRSTLRSTVTGSYVLSGKQGIFN